MTSNPLRKITDALSGTLDVPTAEARATLARQQVIESAAAVEAAKAQLMAADDLQDAGAIQAAEAHVISLDRALDRSTRHLAIAEAKLQRAKDAANESATADARKRLAALVADRERAGAQIEQALVGLEAGVKALVSTDAAIAAVRTDVLGGDFSVGNNCGQAALARHLAVELASRGVQGQPSSMSFTSFAAWLATGNELLRQRT